MYYITSSYWHELNDSERGIYMEFHSPIENNIRIMPENNDLIYDQLVMPTDRHLDIVLNNRHSLNDLENNYDHENNNDNIITDGQMNAILFWVDQHGDYMQNYYENIIYNLDEYVINDNIEPYNDNGETSDIESSDNESYVSESSDN